MAKISPFQGYLFNQKKLNNLDRVVTPPYDVITSQQQEDFYNMSPFNIIRIILGKEEPTDTVENNRYTRAQGFLQDWIEKGLLGRDEKPAIYFLTQEFVLGRNMRRVRKGFITLLYLEKTISEIVKGHEKTFIKPIKDRLQLLRHCKANLSQVLSLYSDPQREMDIYFSKIEETKPIIDFVDLEGVRQRMWRVDDIDIIKNVVMKMADKKLFIADGHHRFQTALDYQAERKKNEPHHTGNEDYNFLMMYFTNMDDKNLAILPTHRLVKRLENFYPESFLKELEEYFDVSVFNNSRLFGENFSKNGSSNSIGIYLKPNIYYIAHLKRAVPVDLIGKNVVLKSLSTVILHNFIFKHILKIDPSLKENIEYSIDFKGVKEAVDKDQAQIAFYLNPTTIDQLKRVMEAGSLMPEKSTYFYPKLLTGLVLNLHSK